MTLQLVIPKVAIRYLCRKVDTVYDKTFACEDGGVASGSEITPCIKIDKLHVLVVYIF